MRFLNLVACILIAAFSPACTMSSPTQSARQVPTTQPVQTPVLADNTIAALNIPYGSDKRLQSLDVYAPRNAKNAPVVVFVHGGGWTRGDKAELSGKPRWLNQNNIILVSVNYRLSPAIMHPEHVNDIAAAIRWTVDNVGAYGGSAQRIFLMGHSAGSHLVSLVAVHPKALAAQNLSATHIAGVISLDGSAFDIPDRIERGSPNIAKNCLRAFGGSLDSQRDGSPLYHVRPNLPRFLFVYVKEGSLNHQQSASMANALTMAGNTASVVRSSAADHFSLDHELGVPSDPATAAILRFIQGP